MSLLSLVKLTNRKLLRISGPDCYPYLQGLICNDLRYLYEPDRIPQRKHAVATANILSTFMLNAQGRAICDMLIYRTPSTREQCKFTPPGEATEPDELLIECDASLASGLANTLYGYRVRRKISISMDDNLSLWCLFPSNHNPEFDITDETALLKAGSSIDTNEVLSDGLTLVNDPRLVYMGMRIITTDREPDKLRASLRSVINSDIQVVPPKDYALHRYLLGVGEGIRDHPESNCFPLECNADFLGSVSFTKGCYLGQELTSRIHHTGVVRKRLMPVKFTLGTNSLSDIPLISGSDIIDESTKKKVGILRHAIKDKALALLRHDLASKSQQLLHEGTKTRLSTHVPFWWNLDG